LYFINTCIDRFHSSVDCEKKAGLEHSKITSSVNGSGNSVFGLFSIINISDELNARFALMFMTKAS
jgi:hypothetical protein